MPTLRLPHLADAEALKQQVPLIAYVLAAVLATAGAGFIYWPAAFIVMAAFLLAVAAL